MPHHMSNTSSTLAADVRHALGALMPVQLAFRPLLAKVAAAVTLSESGEPRCAHPTPGGGGSGRRTVNEAAKPRDTHARARTIKQGNERSEDWLSFLVNSLGWICNSIGKSFSEQGVCA
jgi:hypothetical protein